MFAPLRFLRKILTGRSTKSPTNKPRRQTRSRVILRVEGLEQRDVPTVLFSPHFGPETLAPGSTFEGMLHPTVNLIFSGNYWTSAQGQQNEATMINAIKSMVSGPYLSGLTEYCSDGTAVFGQSWV